MNIRCSRRMCLFPALSLVIASDLSLAADGLPPVTAIVFSPDGESLLVGSQSGVSIVDPRNSTLVRSIPCQLDNVHDLQFSHDGTLLAVVGGIPGEQGTVELWNWPDLTPLATLTDHDDVVITADFSEDGTKLVTASADEVCTTYLLAGLKRQSRFTKHSRAVTGAVFLPDSSTVVSVARDETVRVWQSDSGQSVRSLHQHAGDVFAISRRPGDRPLPMVASAGADRTIRFWQPTIGRMVRFIRLPSEPLCLQWSHQGNALLAGGRDGNVYVIDPETVQVIETISISDGWIYSLTTRRMRDAGEQWAAGTRDGKYKLFRIPSSSSD